MYKAVLFDMDGLIIDTEKYYQKAWIQAAKEMGFDMTVKEQLYLRSCTKKYAEPIMQGFFGPSFDYDKVRDRRKEIMDEELKKHGIEKKPYADEILDGNRMALEKGMILYAFEETCHRPNVYTKDHLFQKDAITDLIDELSQLEDPKKYQSAYDKQKMHPTLATKEELKMIVQMTENKEGKL